MRYLLIGLLGILTLGIVYSCKKELSVEYGTSAKGSLQSSAGDCLPKTVGGSYVAAKSLNDSNYIDVTVDVTAPGPYKIFTDTLNGYSFIATGTFSNTGTNTVRLKGSGQPGTAGADDFTVSFDTSFCDVAVIVLPAGSSGGAATYTLVGAPGTCGSFTPFGNYIKDTTLDGRHYVTVNVNVTSPGTYSITTNTVNGYSFSGSGTFGATGVQTVKLQGNGKPIAAGSNAFTVTAGTSTCTFSVTTAATAPQSCSANVQGTYTVGTALTATNKVSITHTYAAAGSYNVSTNTVNGYSFGPSSYTATAGSNTVTLTATGTPTAAGTNNFTVDFGDGQTCSFSVTAAGVANTDYFPTTLGSYWTYDDGTGADTFKVAVTGPITVNVFSAPGASTSTTYQKFTYSGAYTGDEYYRKDASGNYFQFYDTTGYGTQGATFNQPNFEVRFLQNALTVGATWNSDVTNVTLGGTPGLTLRFAFTRVADNGSLTVNGKTYTNIYKIQLQLKAGTGTTFQSVGTPYYYYYAKGVGLIWVEDGTGAPVQALRYWQVN